MVTDEPEEILQEEPTQSLVGWIFYFLFKLKTETHNIYLYVHNMLRAAATLF